MAIGSVHPWAYVPLWGACLATALVLAWRSWEMTLLRRSLEPHLVAFHLSGRWLVLDPVAQFENQGWSFDLRRPLPTAAPLFLPGLAFMAWVLWQLLPLPPTGQPLTISPPDTRRGLAFVGSLWALHLAAWAAFENRDARARFRRFVALLGLALALIALLQAAADVKKIYGFFVPLEQGTIFGPFVNRNHFAGYMLMVTFTAFGLLARSWRRYRDRVGEHPNLRRRLVALSTKDGVKFLYAAVPAIAAVSALIATTSRGALLAFAAGLLLAGLGVRGGRGVPAWGLALALAAMAFAWFGLDRLGIRFNETTANAPGRTAVWRDSLQRMHGHWLAGMGFNTFSPSMSHTAPWRLPQGATPWPDEIAAAVGSGERIAIRAPADLPSLGWYREAHNDYVQTLVETGVVGALIGLWAVAAAVGAARRDPWTLAAIAGVLMHSFVDFDLQIPAIPALLVCLAAMRSEASPARG